MRVVGYIRVSSKGQIEGDGPKRQHEAIVKFCALQKLELAATYTENGVSGTTEAMEREAFSSMVQFISTPGVEVEAVVVERLDRLARDLMVSEFLLKELRSRGIKVYASDQGALIDMASDEGDPTRKLIRQIIAALAEWEKSQLVLKLRVARQRAKIKNGRCEGNLPYGRDNYEKTIINLMLTWRQQGMTHERIARFLNEGNFTTRKGTKWTRGSVHGILQNRKAK